MIRPADHALLFEVNVKKLLAAAMALGAFGLLGTPWISAAKAKRQRRIVLEQNLGNAERAARQQRIRELGLTPAKLKRFIEEHSGATRARLVSGGHLAAGAPQKGTRGIGPAHRTDAGNRLLQEAKDVLSALLFGGETTQTQFARSHRELLTLTVPRAKAGTFSFLQAATELAAAGTWHDPDGISHDEHADNLIIEIEYGEMADELIGDGIVTALRVINHLEVNEQILYARMVDIEQSTLAD